MEHQSPIKRSHVLFVTVVFFGLLAGFLAERSKRERTLTQHVGAQSPTFDPLVVPRGEHVLSGEVRTKEGAPAADVGVFLYRTEPEPGRAEPLQWAFTEADGGFVIEGLPPALYEVALIQPGHQHTRFTVDVPAETLVSWTLADAPPPVPILPDIQRAELFGRLLPPGALPEPVEGYEVVLRPAAADPLSGALVRRVQTNRAGRFRVERLVAADYEVQVLPPWARGGSWPVLDRVFHRHEPEPPADALLELRLRTARIEGTLVDTEGRPIEGALITVWPRGAPDRLWPPVGSDSAGLFVVPDLPEGTYRIRIRSGSAQEERDVAVNPGEQRVLELAPMDPSAEVESP